jgi:hypothetical protein
MGQERERRMGQERRMGVKTRQRRTMSKGRDRFQRHAEERKIKVAVEGEER